MMQGTIGNVVTGRGAGAIGAAITRLLGAGNRPVGSAWNETASSDRSGAQPVVVNLIDDGDRRFIVEPALTVSPRRDGDHLYASLTHLSVAARGRTREELAASLERSIVRAWDCYATGALTRRDDGYAVGQALQRLVRVVER